MAYLTEERLLAKSRIIEKRRLQSPRVKHTIFLSHSHLDKELVYGFERELKEADINVYIDWQDVMMPVNTNRETADKIKNKIAENDLFMILATKNALKSVWVPWEIGIADQAKGENKIFIIPVADNSGNFTGNEYLQLHNKIEIATDKELGVFKPNTSNGISIKKAILDGGY